MVAPAFLAPRAPVPLLDRMVLDLADNLDPQEQQQKKDVVSSSYGEWIAEARPELRSGEDDDDQITQHVRWDYPHFVLMQVELDAVTAGQQRRVLFQIPIRHGKTQHNTIGYAAYRIIRKPSTRVLICSYNQLMADKFSREIKKIVLKEGVVLSDDRDSAREWETRDGGGVRALGAGSGAASIDADLIIIDDPIGKREDAESQAVRDAVWDWITNDILARCEPHTSVIMQMSRWHKDDPAGRLQDKQKARWRVIDLPARALKYEPTKPLSVDNCPDPLGRKEGAALWPELRGEEWLVEKRDELGEYGFASLLMGRPRPREGGMFKWAWWQVLEEEPLKWAQPLVRYWDLAGTDKKEGNDPDWTSGTLGGRMTDQRTALVDVERFRNSVHARDTKMIECAKSDLAKYRDRMHAPGVIWWIEAESGIAGEDRTTDLVRKLQALGLAVYTEHPTGNKALRAEPLSSKAEAGNVVLVRGAWNDVFRTEAADFTGRGETHDDQVDSAAGCDAKLSKALGAYGTSKHKVGNK